MTDVDWGEEFARRYDALRARAARGVYAGRDPERREDLTGEVIALSWEAWLAVVKRGDDPRPMADAITELQIRRVNSGRKLGSHGRPTEPLTDYPGPRSFHRSGSISCPDQSTHGSAAAALVDVRMPNPAEVACALVDWEAFLADQSPRSAELLALRLEGYSLHEIARLWRVNESAVCRRRARLAAAWSRRMTGV